MKILIIGNSDSTADTSWNFNALKNICNNIVIGLNTYKNNTINEYFNDYEKFND